MTCYEPGLPNTCFFCYSDGQGDCGGGPNTLHIGRDVQYLPSGGAHKDKDGDGEDGEISEKTSHARERGRREKIEGRENVRSIA
jgi:hypothetical protein